MCNTIDNHNQKSLPNRFWQACLQVEWQGPLNTPQSQSNIYEANMNKRQTFFSGSWFLFSHIFISHYFKILNSNFLFFQLQVKKLTIVGVTCCQLFIAGDELSIPSSFIPCCRLSWGTTHHTFRIRWDKVYYTLHH